MGFGEATPLPLDTADGFTVGRDDLTPTRWNRVKESYKIVLKRHRMAQNTAQNESKLLNLCQ